MYLVQKKEKTGQKSNLPDEFPAKIEFKIKHN